MKRATFFADEQHMDELKEIAREERKTLASVAASAERFRITTILTTDRRHFSIIRGKDGNPFTLLP